MEQIVVLREIAKNALMGIGPVRSLRSRMGRTTGAFDKEHAVEYLLSIMEQYRQGMADAGLPHDYFAGKSVLEIGPGANLGVELSLIGEGATLAHALDRFPDVHATEKEADIYEALLQRMSPEQRARCAKTYRTQERRPLFIGETIKYFRNCPLEDAGARVPHKYDIIVSHVALEHVWNLEKGIASIAALLKPGGICIFICNVATVGGVYNYEKEPLRLLYYSDALWSMMYSNRGGANRMRTCDYKRLLEANGFTIKSLAILNRLPMAAVESGRPRLNPRFSKLSDEELSILKFRLVAQLR